MHGGPGPFFLRPMARGPAGNLAGKPAGTMKLWQIEAMAKKKGHANSHPNPLGFGLKTKIDKF